MLHPGVRGSKWRLVHIFPILTVVKNSLVRFCINTVVTLALVACVDFACGKAVDHLIGKISKIGFAGKQHYIMHEMDEEFVIIGSSRAVEHYDSQMLSDNLGVKVFNAGVINSHVLSNCALINVALSRYSPKVMVWEIHPKDLFSEGEDLSQIISFYKSNDYVRQFVNSNSRWDEIVKLQSSLYVHNSKIHTIILRHLGLFDSSNNTGYMPLTGVGKFKESDIPQPSIEHNTQVSQHKLSYLRETIQNIKNHNVKLIISNSPSFYINTNNHRNEILKAVCDSMEVPFIDNESSAYFQDHPELFYDETHMNRDGAEQLTAIFIHQLRQYI